MRLERDGFGADEGAKSLEGRRDLVHQRALVPGQEALWGRAVHPLDAADVDLERG
jgi:hypothetical protein